MLTQVFDEPSHTYVAWGQPVARSVTALVASVFEVFDPEACTQTYLARWAATPGSKYYERIQRVRAEGGDDAEAAARIRDGWRERGELASRLGTELHRAIELDLNGVPIAPPPELRCELAQWAAWKASDVVRQCGLRPLRTELTVAWRTDDGAVVTAGQVDALLIDKHGHHYMFDFKRTAHALDSHAPGVAGRTGRGPLAHVPDTPFMRYSLQQVSRGSVACLRPLPLAPAPRERDSPSCNASLAPLALAQSLYALMLQQTHGVAVDDRGQIPRAERSASDRTRTGIPHRPTARSPSLRAADLRPQPGSRCRRKARRVRHLSGRVPSPCSRSTSRRTGGLMAASKQPIGSVHLADQPGRHSATSSFHASCNSAGAPLARTARCSSGASSA